ncbi:MAG: dynamin family protein [Burkholderiales bacterium]
METQISPLTAPNGFHHQLDALSAWRATLCAKIQNLLAYLIEHDLAEIVARDALVNIKERLSHQKLVIAFVAEFSRGKSELINAIFFSEAGQRVLPAAPGRTTMCPVELGYESGIAASLALLPIETRLNNVPLIELRQQVDLWQKIPLDPTDSDALAHTLREVVRTQWVTENQAKALGFWNDETPDDNPQKNDDGLVEVPVWRHALINYPHPLLRQGLVVLDTPGLNAIGAEPELTLNLLPSAHATLFILAADTGVTKSDLSIWRDHLSTHPMARYVVLNKIDTLVDPLVLPEDLQSQIETQRLAAARILDLPASRVFPLSARQGLTAKISGDFSALQSSRLPLLEAALSEHLLPQRRKMLEAAVADACHRIQSHVVQRAGDLRQQLSGQSLELNSLRGKSDSKVRAMIERVDVEATEFEQCTARLHALRAVHMRLLKNAMADISGDRLRQEVEQMQTSMSASLMNLGAKKAFLTLCANLRLLLDQAHARAIEIREMLAPSFSQINTEFGFSLSLPPAIDLVRLKEEIDLLENSYVQYLGLTHAFRLSQPKFMDQFRHMLLSKLRVVFETASTEFEGWNQAVFFQVDRQIHERRQNFHKRKDALERIQVATGDLERRIAEVEQQDARLKSHLENVQQMIAALLKEAGLLDTALPPAMPASMSLSGCVAGLST